MICNIGSPFGDFDRRSFSLWGPGGLPLGPLISLSPLTHTIHITKYTDIGYGYWWVDDIECVVDDGCGVEVVGVVAERPTDLSEAAFTDVLGSEVNDHEFVCTVDGLDFDFGNGFVVVVNACADEVADEVESQFALKQRFHGGNGRGGYWAW